MSEHEQHIGVGAVVVVKQDGRILLGKRLVKVGFEQWGLPGGHVETGESITAAAKRELLEETGLTADNMTFINVTNDPRETTGHWIHFVFLAEGIHGEPQVTEPDKCEQWQWFNMNELPQPLFFGHKKLLQGLLKDQPLID